MELDNCGREVVVVLGEWGREVVLKLVVLELDRRRSEVVVEMGE